MSAMRLWSGYLVLAALVLAPRTVAAQPAPYEVWVVDQSNAADGGSKLYVFSGTALSGGQLAGQPTVIDLEAAAQGVGAGAGVRPHLLLFNERHSHGILAYVASGHVQVIRASDRKVVSSIDVGEQAHGAVAAPDDSYILVANQNGKKLARIKADFGREQFSHDPAEDFDLKALEDDSRPDNAPICPMFFAPSGQTYVTLRGGGLLVMDTASSPMRVLKSYGMNEVAAAGCGGLAHGGKVYINSGSASGGAIHVFEAASGELARTIDTSALGTDAHGMLVVGGRYLWMANRGDGDNMVVLDTTTDSIVGTFTGFGAAPDLMDISPAGDRVFMTLRGPQNLTGGAPAKGETPGMAVLSVESSGRSGSRAFFVPIGDQSSTSTADPHGIAVRRGASPVAASAPPQAAPVVAPAAAPAAGPVAAQAAPAQTPRALPRTGDDPTGWWVALPAVLALLALVAGLALRRRGRVAPDEDSGG